MFTGKSLVPDCNTLAYRKDNYVCISNVPRLQVTLNKFLHLIQGPFSNFLERVGEFSNKISTFVFFSLSASPKNLYILAPKTSSEKLQLIGPKLMS